MHLHYSYSRTTTTTTNTYTRPYNYRSRIPKFTGVKDHWPHFSDAFTLFKLNAAWGIYIIIYLCYNLNCTTYRHRGQEPFIYLEEYGMGDTHTVMNKHRPLPSLRPAASMPIVEHTADFKLQHPQSRPAPVMEVTRTSAAPRRRLPTSSSGSSEPRTARTNNNSDLDNTSSVDQGHVTEGRGISAADPHTDATGSENYIGNYIGNFHQSTQ